MSALRPWRIIYADGSHLGILATDRTHALQTARELCPGFVRVEQEGDW